MPLLADVVPNSLSLLLQLSKRLVLGGVVVFSCSEVTRMTMPVTTMKLVHCIAGNTETIHRHPFGSYPLLCPIELVLNVNPLGVCSLTRRPDLQGYSGLN